MTISTRRPAVRKPYAVPSNLLSFMLTGWEQTNSASVKPLCNAAAIRSRRARLSRRFTGEFLIIPTGHRKVRANDMFFKFRPGTECYYLTGAMEPDCVLVMLPKGKIHEHILFVEPYIGRTDETFFSDPVKGEFWDGRRMGVTQTERVLSIRCRPLTELPAVLKTFKRGVPVRVLRGVSHATEEMLRSPTKKQKRADTELAAFLAEMRLVKDAYEISELRKAVAATKLGFDDVIARLKTARSERELEGVFWTRARVEGNDTGYTSVVAAGAHACTLHWMDNSGAIRKGDLLLLDAGVEGRTLYTADITRTLPISGRFNGEQRAVYEIVFAAQCAALKCVKPGSDFLAPYRAAMRILARGLERLNILPMSAAEALDDENQFFRRYTLHGVSHMLGLDVHDCARARAETYRYGRLKVGMVLTVEPGVYFQPDDLTVPPKYRGIGVRIEDNVVVTKTGYELLSAALPRQADEVELWMRKVWAR